MQLLIRGDFESYHEYFNAQCYENFLLSSLRMLSLYCIGYILHLSTSSFLGMFP